MAITGLIINGQLFEFDKELNQSIPYSTQQLSAGIKVDWGDNNVVILPGQTAKTTALIGKNWRAYRITRKDNSINTIYGQGFETSAGVEGNLFVLRGYFYRSSTNVSSTSLCASVGIWEEKIIYSLLASLFKSYQKLQEYNNCSGIYAYKVETNTGAISSRETTTAPNVSLQNGDCKLTINFADGTTEQLTYPVCPSVAPYECFNCPGLTELINEGIRKIDYVLQL